jgi:hypothetical protein
MTATPSEREVVVVQTRTGWMVTGVDYPRITVMADTREAAIAAYEAGCSAWLSGSTE